MIEVLRARSWRVGRAVRRTAKRSRTLRRVYVWAVGRRQRAYVRLARSGLARNRGGVSPERMVWIFCTSRSGSTWLRSLLRDLTGGEVWEEPKVAQLFGNFRDTAQKGQLASPHFILGDPTRKGWIDSVRNFVLDGAGYAHPFLGPQRHLIIKEPDGARGAPMLMEALPESRMVLLVRDPRDVAASALDATRKGNWMYEASDDEERKNRLAGRKPERFVRGRARAYLRQIGNGRLAYDRHPGPKAVIRYEDLMADTLSTLQRACDELQIPADPDLLARVVERHSWKNVPEKEKGGGKFYRKASPGGWREDLTPEQVGIVESVTAPLLAEFYPEP